MFLINGREQEMLAASDRAIQFGDGCFTTARIKAGNVTFLTAHLRRLRDACEKLMLAFQDWSVLEEEMVRLARDHDSGVLKVIITRGSGGRGYSAAACHSPSRILRVSDYPAHYSRWREEGIRLAPSPVRLGRNPHLAGIKHLNRLEQVLIRTHLEQTEAEEALVLDSDGWLTECCAANLFWRKGSTVFTPRLDYAGVKGIMREHCIAMLASSSFRVTEVNATPDALVDADEVLICNALMPLVPVRACGDLTWTSRALYDFLAPLCEHSISS